MELKEYILNWNKLDQKTCNEDLFINLFISYLKGIDNINDVMFEGDGAYFGRQIVIHKDHNYISDTFLKFELAYDKNQIRVYSGNHHGYWQPEFISINGNHERWEELSNVLFDLLRNVFCL